MLAQWTEEQHGHIKSALAQTEDFRPKGLELIARAKLSTYKEFKDALDAQDWDNLNIPELDDDGTRQCEAFSLDGGWEAAWQQHRN